MKRQCLIYYFFVNKNIVKKYWRSLRIVTTTARTFWNDLNIEKKVFLFLSYLKMVDYLVIMHIYNPIWHKMVHFFKFQVKKLECLQIIVTFFYFNTVQRISFIGLTSKFIFVLQNSTFFNSLTLVGKTATCQ